MTNWFVEKLVLALSPLLFFVAPAVPPLSCTGEACSAIVTGIHDSRSGDVVMRSFGFQNNSNRRVDVSYQRPTVETGGKCTWQKINIGAHAFGLIGGLCDPGYTADWDASDKTPPAPSTLNAACLAGDWKEQYEDSLVWHVAVAGDTLSLVRADHFVSGSFVRSGDTWYGNLIWKDASQTVTWNMRLSPAADCSAITTNQAFWYHRQ